MSGGIYMDKKQGAYLRPMPTLHDFAGGYGGLEEMKRLVNEHPEYARYKQRFFRCTAPSADRTMDSEIREYERYMNLKLLGLPFHDIKAFQINDFANCLLEPGIVTPRIIGSLTGIINPKMRKFTAADRDFKIFRGTGNNLKQLIEEVSAQATAHMARERMWDFPCMAVDFDILKPNSGRCIEEHGQSYRLQVFLHRTRRETPVPSTVKRELKIRIFPEYGARTVGGPVQVAELMAKTVTDEASNNRYVTINGLYNKILYGCRPGDPEKTTKGHGIQALLTSEDLSRKTLAPEYEMKYCHAFALGGGPDEGSLDYIRNMANNELAIRRDWEVPRFGHQWDWSDWSQDNRGARDLLWMLFQRDAGTKERLKGILQKFRMVTESGSVGGCHSGDDEDIVAEGRMIVEQIRKPSEDFLRTAFVYRYGALYVGGLRGGHWMGLGLVQEKI